MEGHALALGTWTASTAPGQYQDYWYSNLPAPGLLVQHLASTRTTGTVTSQHLACTSTTSTIPGQCLDYWYSIQPVPVLYLDY